MVDWDIGEPYLEDLGKNLELLKEKVGKYGRLKDEAKVKETAKEAALVLAVDDILAGEEGTSIATKVLTESALRACEKTGEYDYPPFTSKLTSAIINNGKRLFGFSFADNSIKIDLFPLGHADQWVAAAHVTRLKFQIGESRKAGRSIGDMPAALKFWMEKIYKPAREGQPVVEKPRQSPLSPEMQRMGRLLKPKVSADRQEKYNKVIKDRLSQFSSKEAPFWQVINFGNQTVGHGGKSAPYPLFEPTRFVEDADKILTSLFRESISIWTPKVEDALYKSMVKDVEVEAEGRTEEEYDQEVVRAINKEVGEIEAGEGPEAIGTRTDTRVKTIHGIYDIYKGGVRLHAPAGSGKGGQFIKQMLELN